MSSKGSKKNKSSNNKKPNKQKKINQTKDSFNDGLKSFEDKNQEEKKFQRTPKKFSNINKPVTNSNLDTIDNPKIPSNTVDKGSLNTIHYELSQPGKDFKGITKKNQDRYIMLDSLFELQNINIFGIMDGHGENGHLVSEYVKNSITSFFNNKSLFATKNKKNIDIPSIYSKLSSKNYSFIRTFLKDLNTNLTKEKFDVDYSGTTCVIVYHIDNKIICSNIGDSRALLVRTDDYNNFYTEQLSFDHKPNNPGERERILNNGGIVAPCKEEIKIREIMRVWVKDKLYPGLAISRTIGDEVSKSIGVTCDADIIEKNVTDDMCFIVVASDGIWDFLSNEEVKDIVLPFYPYYDAKAASEQLIAEASKCWEEEGKEMDDISVVVYFFKRDI